MERTYTTALTQHLKKYRQMIFVAGPRQVGKTTLCQSIKHQHYFNWDNQDHRALIIEGPGRIASEIGLDALQKKPLIIIFDEIHKYSKWKDFLKGFFDVYGTEIKVIVTGSSRLDIFKKGSDSLMGRYFLYRLHPLSVREIIAPRMDDKKISSPKLIKKNTFEALLKFGGFPEPYLKADTKFQNRWKRLRQQQLFSEDIRSLTQIQDIFQLEHLAELLKNQAGQLTNYSSLATRVKISVDTVRRWLVTLESFYYCFAIQPWFKNISRSLQKQPKIYLWDWSLVDDPGTRAENFIASHLLKAVHWWTDNGFGEYGLYFLRDKDKREVDFLVTQDRTPWFMVEVKASQNKSISKNLHHFQKQAKVPYAFQVSFDQDYLDIDCFTTNKPVIVPAQTLLSQLI